MKLLKNSITIRGDSLYCPLSLSLDSYGNCLTDCWHCYFRNLNHIWDQEIKPADIDLLEKKLSNGIKNKTPNSFLSHCLKNKKTIRWGNKSDPFQEVENKYKIAIEIFNLLIRLNWSFVIQTRFMHNLKKYEKYIFRAFDKNLITIMPVISPGGEKDWEILERKRTTSIAERLKYSNFLIRKGIPLGVNGEPFIPGYHTIYDFENILKLLKDHCISSYNTYSFHFNAFVAKRLHKIGIDIEKIWYYNQDKEWKKILEKLIDLSKKYNIKLGCPDFVNSGKNYIEPSNTCCGINVPNPITFNTHYFKKYKQKGFSTEKIIQLTDDNSGDMELAKKIIDGEKCDFYTLEDAGFEKINTIKCKKLGLCL